MADETTAVGDGVAATVDAVSTMEAPKKRRAPRRMKAAPETAGAETAAKAGKGVKERKKRVAKATVTTAVNADKPVVVSVRKARAAAKPADVASTVAPASAADEMAELLRLEEENKRLRQTLAEKLRAENADLRKRLGLA